MKVIVLTLLVCLCGTVLAQVKSEKISRTITFEKIGPQSVLILANINGSIAVEGYSGSDVVMEVEKTISAKSPDRLEVGIKTLDLGVIDRGDTMILYVKGVTHGFGRRNNSNSDTGGWGYDWRDKEMDDLGFDFKMNFRIRIPGALNLVVSTINEGDVKVSNVSAKVIANNINGSISLEQVSSSVKANTINGDVDVTYSRNPVSDCRFYTLNGNITASFRKGLSSTVSFKSFNGEFFTNLPELNPLPVEVRRSNTEKGTRYEINGNQFKAGSGGPRLDFETFNGNVYLREQ